MLDLLRSRSLRSRFLVLLTGFLVVFGLLTLVMNVLASHAQTARGEVERELTRNLDALASLNRNLLAAAAYTHTVVCDGNTTDFARIDQNVIWAFEDAQSVFADPSLREASDYLTGAQLEWEAIAKVVRSPRQNGEQETPALEKEVANRFTNISHLVTQAYLLTRDQAEIHLERAKSDTRGLMVWLAVLLALALAAGAVNVISLYRRVLRPLGLLRDGAVRWHGGNLEHRLSMTTADEFGDLAHTLNEMVGHLEALVAKLADENTRDHLTGLLNRRAFDHALTLELERASRYLHPLALLMIDVDHFKAVNDRFGHLTGDHVLRVISQRISASTRATDSAFRYGGEEVAVILPETTADGAAPVAERIRAAVARPISSSGSRRPFFVTVSIGVAQVSGAAPDSIGRLVAAADAALYDAKRLGRNQVCCDQSLLHETATQDEADGMVQPKP